MPTCENCVAGHPCPAERAQEGFLVLSGECTLIVEEAERPLRQWDYFHCPADTRDVIVGAVATRFRHEAMTMR